MREQGYAVAVDELEQGLTAVAAPIRNAHGDIIASMSVSGPSFRLDRASALETALEATLVGPRPTEVSSRLGWNDPVDTEPGDPGPDRVTWVTDWRPARPLTCARRSTIL